MKLRHSVVIQENCDLVWAMLLNPNQWAQYFPGATLYEVNGSSFVGTVDIKIGPLEFSYEGVATYVERIVSENRAVIDVTGAQAGGLSQTRARIEVQLTAMTAHATHVDISSEVLITPELDGVGRAILQDSTGRVINTFVKNINAALRTASDSQLGFNDDDFQTTEIEVIREGMAKPQPRRESSPEKSATDNAPSILDTLRNKVDKLSAEYKVASTKKASDNSVKVVKPKPAKTPKPASPPKSATPAKPSDEEVNRRVAIAISVIIVGLAWWWTSTH